MGKKTLLAGPMQLRCGEPTGRTWSYEEMAERLPTKSAIKSARKTRAGRLRQSAPAVVEANGASERQEVGA
jgi:hypothetical protein